MPCLSTKHQQVEKHFCTRKLYLENKHSSPAEGTGGISPSRHRAHIPFQGGQNLIPSVVPSTGELQRWSQQSLIPAPVRPLCLGR